MAAELMNFKPEQLVWGKLGSYPFWPGQIVDQNLFKREPPPHIKNKNNVYLIRFFGSHDFGWVSIYNVLPYDLVYDEKSKKSRSKIFLRGLEEANLYKETGALPEGFMSYFTEEEEEEEVPEEPVEEPVAEVVTPTKQENKKSRRRSSGKKTPKELEPEPEPEPETELVPLNMEAKRRRLRVMRRLGLYAPEPKGVPNTIGDLETDYLSQSIPSIANAHENKENKANSNGTTSNSKRQRIYSDSDSD